MNRQLRVSELMDSVLETGRRGMEKRGSSFAGGVMSLMEEG